MPTITRIKGGNANCFCVEENGSAILIDTGWVQHRDKIMDACKDKNIRLIVLTHGHVDHIQNVAALKKERDIHVAMHKADIGLISGNMDQPFVADKLIGKVTLALTKRNSKQNIDTFEPDFFIEDGDALDDYGVSAKIVGLPGHTNGSIGVLAGNDFFVGDALFNIVFPTKALMYGDKAMMVDSAKKISAYKSATIHFGHGKSIANRIW